MWEVMFVQNTVVRQQAQYKIRILLTTRLQITVQIMICVRPVKCKVDEIRLEFSY